MQQLAAESGDELLLKSAVWMTLLEMPDVQLDRVIRSAQANWGVGHVQAREIPALGEPGISDAVQEAIVRAFAPAAAGAPQVPPT